MTTRRDLLIGASCAAFAAAAPFAPALGAVNTRRNIADVEKDPGALQALRDAIDVLRKKDDYGKRPAIDGWFALECGVPGDPLQTLPAAVRFLRDCWERAV